MKQKVWIGVDPGGVKNFGVAILFPDGTTQTWCVDCADECIDKLRSIEGIQPIGIGVDAPLWWSSSKSSDRHADMWIRKKYGLSGGNVQTCNSLRGAALVQGAMLVHRIRTIYPSLSVTESHPKAVWVALKVVSWSAYCEKFQITSSITGEQEHERDAIIAAICAREGFEGRWVHDLSQTRLPSELDPKTYWLGPVYYYWPES